MNGDEVSRIFTFYMALSILKKNGSIQLQLTNQIC